MNRVYLKQLPYVKKSRSFHRIPRTCEPVVTDYMVVLVLVQFTFVIHDYSTYI